jgi:hypothetical protein
VNPGQLHQARRRALARSSDRLAWLEWSIDPALDDAGNPTTGSYSTRITYKLN